MFLELKDTLEQKDKLSKSKTKFINDTVHEISTPLTIISMNNSIRDMELTGNGEISLYSKNIKDAVFLLKNTIADVNYFFQNDGENEYKKENIFLNDFLKSRTEQFYVIAKNQSIDLEILKLDKFNFEISYIELTRIIDNNITNSIKYSYPNTKVYISLEKIDENRCEMTFQNFGKEIKNPENIFDRFYRENQVKGGFGIGLNLVKSICDKYNIKIEVSSCKNNGIIFKFIFSMRIKIIKMIH